MIYKLLTFHQPKHTRGMFLIDWEVSSDKSELERKGLRRKELNEEYVILIQTFSCTAVERL